MKKIRYRLIKPDWGKPEIKGAANPKFVREIEGPDTLEGVYSTDFVKKKNEQGYNVYFFPNHNSKPIEGKYLQGRDIDVFNCVFVDMDLKDGEYADKGEFVEKLLKFPIQPNRIVDSGNGIHAYWDVKNLDRERYVELQLRLIEHFKTDTSIWTVCQLMRVPGFYNTKKVDKPVLAELNVLSEEPTSYKKLAAHLPEISEDAARKARLHLNKLDGVTEIEEFSDYEVDELPVSFQTLLEKNKKAKQLFSYTEIGSRSEMDMSLANLLYKNDISKKDAIQVLMNTSKAKSKGSSRRSYAVNTVEKVYTDRSKFYVENVGARKRSTLFQERQKGVPVNGPDYLDCLGNKWKKSNVLGIVGGSGVGKTTISLDIFAEMIENNPDNDDIYIFFSLEMPEWEIIERWDARTGGKEEYSKRLFVVTNEDDEGNSRHINLQQIYWYARDISKATGKNIGAIVIDHIGIINKYIDPTKEPSFGVKGDDIGYDNLRSLSFEVVCAKMKELAKSLNCFLVIQSQTTKAKAKDGDTPLGLDAAYGTAQFEWYVDYLITIWQPLRRVENKTDLRVLGWQYCKIRSKSKKDKVKLNDPKFLAVDIETGELRPLDDDELQEATELNKEASRLRKIAEKKEVIEYTNSVSVKKLRLITGKKKAPA